MVCHTYDGMWYVLCARNVVDSWCATHVMKYGVVILISCCGKLLLIYIVHITTEAAI